MLAPALRIFVSSSFADLDAEREALRRTVFPVLQALGHRHGVEFEALDLRWEWARCGRRAAHGLDLP